MNALLIRLLQAALNSLALPPGIQAARVMAEMPINGWPTMPFININLELVRQEETVIGEDVENPTAANIWTLFALARRRWRITITSPDAEERDFYRDTLLALLRILHATVFAALGLDAVHTAQAASYALAREHDGRVPGFYCADIILELEGGYNTSVRTEYPVILGISADPTYSPAASLHVAL